MELSFRTWLEDLAPPTTGQMIQNMQSPPSTVAAQQVQAGQPVSTTAPTTPNATNTTQQQAATNFQFQQQLQKMGIDTRTLRLTFLSMPTGPQAVISMMTPRGSQRLQVPATQDGIAQAATWIRSQQQQQIRR